MELVKKESSDKVKAIVLDLVRERLDKDSEIIELALDQISNRNLIVAAMDSLVKEGRLLIDHDTGFVYIPLE